MRYAVVGIGVASLAFFFLEAAVAVKHMDPIWVPIVLVAAGWAFAFFLPVVVRFSSLPNYLSITSEGVTAIFGTHKEGRRVGIPPEDITNLTGGGAKDFCVVLWARAPGKPDGVLRFQLPNESFAALDSYRRRTGQTAVG